MEWSRSVATILSKNPRTLPPDVLGESTAKGVAACGSHRCVGPAHTFDQLVSASVSCYHARPFNHLSTPISSLEKVPFFELFVSSGIPVFTVGVRECESH